MTVHHTTLRLAAHDDGAPRTTIGSAKAPCRFCGARRREGEVWKEAHVFPAALSAHEVVSLEECSGCNAAASILEGDLAASLAPSRAAHLFPAARKPNRRVNVGTSEQKIMLHARGRRLDFLNDEEAPPVPAPDGRSLRIHGTSPTYVLRNVARAAVRLGLFLLPTRLLVPARMAIRAVRHDEELPVRCTMLPTRDRGPVVQLDVRWFDPADAPDPPPGADVLPLFVVQLLYGHQGFLLRCYERPPPARPDVVALDHAAKDQAVWSFDHGRDDVPPPSHAEIAARAHAKWMARGCPDDPAGAEADWRAAHVELIVERSGGGPSDRP